MSTRGTSTRQKPNWRAFAACKATPNLMFPATGDLVGIEEAKRVCHGCSVITQCLNDAMAYEEGRSKDYRHGVAGGLSSSQRYVLYSRSRKVAA